MQPQKCDADHIAVTHLMMTRRQHQHRLRLLVLYLLLVPTFGTLVVFDYFPAASAFFHAFYDWHPGFHSAFVGMGNFIQALTDHVFLLSFLHVALMVLAGMTLGLAVPFVVSEMLLAVRSRRLQSVFKTALLVPMAVPTIVTILLWGAMLTPEDGVVDQLLKSLGLPHSYTWYGSPHLALISIILIGFPWVAGLPFLVYLAGLQAIPEEIRDAARIDGAGALTRMIRMDIPLVMSQTRLLLVLAIISQMQNLIPMLLLTQGGPDFATMVPTGWMFDQAFTYGNWGYAAALSVVIFLVMLIVSVASWVLVTRQSNLMAD